MKRILVYCLLVCLCVSCKKEETRPAVQWTDYYPLTIGTTRTYDCVSIRIDLPTAIQDTSYFQVRETVVDCISDTNSCKVYVVQCEKKTKGSDEWKPYLSQSVQQYDHQIVRVEENVPYVVLKFPAKTTYSWDLNAYNTLQELQIYYDKIDEQDATTMTDSVLFVLQQDFKSLYTYQYAEERYAKNIGLVYRKNIDVESQPNHAPIDLNEPIESRITKGTIVTYKLIDCSIK